MRLPILLLPLTSLILLAAAEPGEVYTCTKPLGEIGGGCGHVLALGRCADFSSDQAGHVRRIKQTQGAFCYYYPQKGCSTGQRSLKIDTREGDYVQDVAENVGRQLVSVHCFRRLKGEGEGEGEGADIGVGTEVQARSDAETLDGFVDDTTSPIDIPDVFGSSDLILCLDPLLNDTPCYALNATDICAPLGPVLAHNVRAINQAKGTACKFYEHDCAPRHAVLSVNSLQHAAFRPVDAETGAKLGAVVCRRKQSNALHAEAAPRSVLAAPRSASWEGDASQPLYICRHPNLEGRCTFYAEPGCLNNPFGPEAVEPIMSLKVREGWRCAFYHEPNCAATSPPNYEEARGDDKALWTVPYTVVSMACGRNPIVGTNATITSTTNTATSAPTPPALVPDHQVLKKTTGTVLK